MEKSLHKILRLFIKYMPMIISLAYLLNTLSAFYNIDIPVLSLLFGVSLLPLIFMYLCSVIFKFCLYHRVFLHYILINDILNIIDYYYKLPINDCVFISLYLIITCITLFIALYDYQRNKKSARKDN